MNGFSSVKRLLAERFGDRFEIRPPRDQIEINAFAQEHHLVVTSARRQFLTECDGITFGDYTLFGVQDFLVETSADRMFVMYPQWMNYHWWPVSTDGCGNYWIESVDHQGAVLFIDCATTPDAASYVAASGLWLFAAGLIRKASAKNEAEEVWPFDPENALNTDPQLMLVDKGIPLPWEA